MRRKISMGEARQARRLMALSAFLLFVAGTGLFAVRALAAGDVKSINDHWGYWPERVSYADGIFRVEGYFFNHNKGYDIGKMTGFSLQILDAVNRPVTRIAVNAGTALEEIIIPSGSTYDYSFAVAIQTMDASMYDFSSFSATVHCDYLYYSCHGAGHCPTCAPWRASASPTPTHTPINEPRPTPAVTLTRVKCKACDGKGSVECTLCDAGILYYEKKRSVDYGGGSVAYEVPVYCRACTNGRVDCLQCDGGWRWELVQP